MTWLRRVAFGALLMSATTAAFAAPADEAAIRAVVAAEQAAFNAHDARAYAGLLESDADIVVPFGWLYQGRAAFEQGMSEAFRYVLAQASEHADAVTVRAIAPDLALAHVTWTTNGVRAPDGGPGDGPHSGIESQLLRRTDGRWLIVSAQQTIALPRQTIAISPKPVRKCLLANRDGKCLVFR